MCSMARSLLMPSQFLTAYSTWLSCMLLTHFNYWPSFSTDGRNFSSSTGFAWGAMRCYWSTETVSIYLASQIVILKNSLLVWPCRSLTVRKVACWLGLNSWISLIIPPWRFVRNFVDVSFLLLSQSMVSSLFCCFSHLHQSRTQLSVFICLSLQRLLMGRLFYFLCGEVCAALCPTSDSFST